MSVADRLTEIRERIARACQQADRDESDVRLIAVSKRQPLEKIQQALAAGQRDFGENYGQELRDKAQQFAAAESPPIWHFIGPIQSNKVRYIGDHADWVHTLSRTDIARSLLTRSQRAEREPCLLIEVNIANEPQKAGLSPESLVDTVGALREAGCKPVGLMCMPPFELSPAQAARHFARLRGLGQELLRAGLLPERHELSMGMSADFAEAIAEGATLVRVGTAIFGARET